MSLDKPSHSDQFMKIICIVEEGAYKQHPGNTEGVNEAYSTFYTE